MLTLAEIQAVPKVLLHDHLDGGLRPQTILELARETFDETGRHLIVRGLPEAIARLLVSFQQTA